jgi:hypothetical protein
MTKDNRYSLLPSLYKIGHLKQFSDIFVVVPKSVIARDLGFNYTRFTNFMLHPTKFTVKEVMCISYLTGIPALQLLKWIIESAKSTK